MVTRILLLLLSALLLAKCIEYKIDWSQCDLKTDCFIPESCIEQRSDNTNLVQRKNEKLKSDDCNAVIQIRYYTYKKYHVMIQVKTSAATETIADSGVLFNQGSLVFGCAKNGPSGDAQLFHIVPTGTQTYEANSVFCAFTIESKADAPIDYQGFGLNTALPALEYTVGSLISVKFASDRSDFWKLIRVQCNPEKVTSVATSSDVFLETEIDTFAFAPISCASSESMIITQQGKPPVVLDKNQKLDCTKRTWKYTHESQSKLIPETETFNVLCGVRFCSLCTDFQPEDRSNCPFGCDTINPISTDVAGSEGCKQYTCPNNEWKVNEGERHSVNAPIECKQQRSSVTYSRNSAWYFKPENANPIEVTKASCLDTTVCWKNKHFNEGCPEGVKTGDCKNVNKTANLEELFCPDGLSLFVSSGDKLSSVEWPRLKCDYYEGKYRVLNGEVLQNNRENSFVGCAPKLPPTTTALVPAESKISTGAIVGGVSGFLIIAAIVAAVIIVVRRRRKAARIAAALALAPETKKKIEPPPKEDAVYQKPVLTSYQKRDPWLKRVRDRRKVILSVDLNGRLTHGDFLNKILPDFTFFSFEQRRQVLYRVMSFQAYKQGSLDDMRFEVDNGNFLQFWLLFREAEEHNMDCMQSWEIMFRCVRQMYEYMEFNGKLDYINLDKRIKARMIVFAKPILDELTWHREKNEEAIDTQMRFFVVRVLLWAEEESVLAEVARQATLEVWQLEPPLTAVIVQWRIRYMGQGEEFSSGDHWKRMVAPDPRTNGPDEYQFGTVRQHILYGLCSAMDNSQKDKFELMIDILEKVMDVKNHRLFVSHRPFSPVDMYWAFLGALSCHTNWDDAVSVFIDKTNGHYRKLREDQLERMYPGDDWKDKREAERKLWRKATMETYYMVAELMNIGHLEDFKKIGEVYTDFGIENDSEQFKHDFLNKCLMQRVKNLDLRLVVDIKNKKCNKDGRRKGKEGLNAVFMKVLDDFEQSFRNFEMAHINYKTPLEMLDVPSEKEEDKKKREEEEKAKAKAELEKRVAALNDPDKVKKAEELKKAIADAPKRNEEEQKKLDAEQKKLAEEEERENEAFLKMRDDMEVPKEDKEGVKAPVLPKDWSQMRKASAAVFKQPEDKTQEIDEGPGAKKAEEPPKKDEEGKKKVEEKEPPKVGEEKTQDDPSKSKSKSKSGPKSAPKVVPK